MVQRLLDCQADCNLASEVGTPLHWAVGSGHTPAAEVLLRHGADANLANPEGVAPILMAAAAGEPEDPWQQLAGRTGVRAEAGRGAREPAMEQGLDRMPVCDTSPAAVQGCWKYREG